MTTMLLSFLGLIFVAIGMSASAPQGAVSVGAACFFGIMARVVQAAGHQRALMRRMGGDA